MLQYTSVYKAIVKLPETINNRIPTVVSNFFPGTFLRALPFQCIFRKFLQSHRADMSKTKQDQRINSLDNINTLLRREVRRIEEGIKYVKDLICVENIKQISKFRELFLAEPHTHIGTKRVAHE